ncbi:MAG: phosphate signaling complex protein PhoU [Pseudomonadota bacterium]
MPKRLQRELEKLKKRILSLGTMVEERVRMAIKSMGDQNAEFAEQVIRTDYEIDALEVEIEEECLKILALHQPVAMDLRFLAAVIKINNDLERIGDEAANIAKCVNYMAKRERVGIPFEYTEMSEKAESMLKMSLDALVNLDLDLAFRVLTMDDEVDKIYGLIYDQIKEIIRKLPDRVGYLINMFLIARYLERIADHATNIAEEVIYLIEGEIIRHGKWGQGPKRIDPDASILPKKTRFEY